MTDIVEQQVKTLLTRFKNEVVNASSNMKRSGSDMANALTPARTQIEHLLTTTQRLAKDGSLVETRKGYDDLGRSITEVYKNGLLLSKNTSAESKLSQDIKQANQLYQEQLR